MSTNASRTCSAATLDRPQPPLTGVTSIVTPGQRLLVVVARPHEATVGCGSLIAAAAEAGVAVTIASATRGERAPSRLGLSPDDLAEQRLLELRLAADALGARRVTTLGYADSGEDGGEDGEPTPGSWCSADERQVVIDVLGVFRTARPDAIVVVADDDLADDIADDDLADDDRLNGGRRDRDRVRSATLAAVDVARIVGEDIAVYLAGCAPDARATHRIDVSGVASKHQLAISMHSSLPWPLDGSDAVRRSSTSDAQHLVRVR